MPEQQPPNWFDGQEPSTDDPDYETRKKQLLAELPKLQARQKDRGRAQSFYPYLLVRSVLGDRGDRPINVPFWESPDIWTAAGDPATTPAIPPDHGGVLNAGQPNTVYAHCWNLGFAPLAGVVVEFWWFNPSLGIDGTHGHLIGTARCELAGRGMPGSHKLVKCPKPWVPVVENGGHECLVVRMYGIGDPLGANEWAPWLNRHVAQRNVSVVSTAQNSAQLIRLLDATAGMHRLQLIQVGARQGELAISAVAPTAKISPNTRTHILSELHATKGVVLEHPAAPPAAVLAPVHALAAGGAPAPPKLQPAGNIAVIHPAAVLPGIAEIGGGESRVAALLNAVPKLHPKADVLGAPPGGEVHVLRIANYDANHQLVGGYTMVVTGA